MNLDKRPLSDPTNVRWIVFALGCGTSWMLYLHRYTFGLIKPKLVEEFGWTTTQLGLLDSTFALCYAVFQVPAGILADALGAHLFLTAIILVWSVALGLLALAPDLGWMRAARAAFGAGQAGAFATLSRITRTWFPTSVRTSVQGWIGVFFGRMGGACAHLLFAGFLIGVLHLSWRESVYLFAAAGIVLAVLFLLLFRNSPRRHPLVNEAEAQLIEGGAGGLANGDVRPSGKPAERLSVAALVGRMSPRSILNLLALNLQSWLSTAADNIYSSWVPLFLYQVHRLEFKELGIYSMLPLLGGACGGAVGGFLNDRMIRRTGNRRWSRSGVGLTGKGTAGLLLFSALLFYDQPYLFCGLLFFVKFFGDWSLAASWGTVTDIGGRTSATVFAFNNAVASTAEILAPLVFGYVAQYYSWHTGFLIVGIVYVLCAASWLLVNCTIPVVAER